MHPLTICRFVHASRGNQVMRGKVSPSLRADRRAFYDEYQAALDRLQADPAAWAALLAEDRLLDGYLAQEEADE